MPLEAGRDYQIVALEHRPARPPADAAAARADDWAGAQGAGGEACIFLTGIRLQRCSRLPTA